MKQILVLISVYLLVLSKSHSQDTVIVNTPDPDFLKPLGLNNQYYWQLKDSLPDAVYLVYKSERGKIYKKCPLPIIIGSYANGKKNGTQFEYGYTLDKSKCRVNNYREINYKEGKKHGIERFVFFPYTDDLAVMTKQGEFKNGLKHGFFIEFDRGVPIGIEYFQKGKKIDSSFHLLDKDLVKYPLQKLKKR